MKFGIAVSGGAIVQGPAAIQFKFNSGHQVSAGQLAKLEHSFEEALGVDWVTIALQSANGATIDVSISPAGRTNVRLKQVLLSEDWEAFKTMAQLPVALGRDTNGRTLAADLSELPHVLIAGTTGSGKSACIDAVLASLLFQFTPEQVRFLMIDMRSQMQIYENLPHLAFPVISDRNKVLIGLRWLSDEIDRRYKIFARVGVRNIASFNERDRSSEIDNASTSGDVIIPNRLPFIVVVILSEKCPTMQAVSC